MLGLAVPVLTKVLVDQILPFRIVDVMGMLGIGLLILVLAQLVTSYLRAAVLVYLQGRLDASSRSASSSSCLPCRSASSSSDRPATC